MTPSVRLTQDVELAANILREGGIIGLPTETVYGLAALADNEAAVKRVFETKGRPAHHPLIVHLGPRVNPENWGIFNDVARALAKAFWPGSLTLLVPRTDRVSDWVTGGRDTVALRVPSHPMALQLLNDVGTGVVAPSANRFGKVSPTTAQHVVDDLGADVDIVLDGGPCEVGLESTIVECVGEAVRILRPGVISAEDIRRVTSLVDEKDDGEARAPGMLASHYAPAAEVKLFESRREADEEIENLTRAKQSSTLVFYDDVRLYAENLYSDLRDADRQGIHVVCAVLPEDIGIGTAIRDRLAKAAHR
jgi:L-threonylcarbamoyladenylate synthase